ncbi:MAG TPA: DUF5684 domain-containing protein [Chthoniobacterales bacterium]
MLAQADTDTANATAAAAGGAMGGIIGLVIGLLIVVSMWKIFAKAGQPGWAAIIPIYNYYIWCKIVGRPGWWVLLLLICAPIFGIILCIDLAKSFGQGVGFALGLIFLSIIFFPILAFGSYTYIGPSAAPKA